MLSSQRAAVLTKSPLGSWGARGHAQEPLHSPSMPSPGRCLTHSASQPLAVLQTQHRPSCSQPWAPCSHFAPPVRVVCLPTGSRTSLGSPWQL